MDDDYELQDISKKAFSRDKAQLMGFHLDVLRDLLRELGKPGKQHSATSRQQTTRVAEAFPDIEAAVRGHDADSLREHLETTMTDFNAVNPDWRYSAGQVDVITDTGYLFDELVKMRATLDRDM